MLNTVNPINEAIRSIFMTFDMCIYYLLRFVYQLFFHIATFNILDSELIYNMFSRIQLIIGVFMLFQLVMIIIKGIVNPDTVTDSKTGGAGNIIMRIIVSLALLALIVPINISNPRNEYEKQVNNNGILFGTLYSLQYRILSNNTIARLILGDEDTAVQDSPYDPLTGNTMFGSLNRFANRFTATVIKMFYVPYTDSEGNYVCNDPLNNVYQKTIYEDDDTEPFLLIAGATNTCTPIPSTDVSVPGGTSTATRELVNTGEVYSISMSFLLSTLAGGALVILLIMITFEVAKRVFQLAALQLLAPIPIISYMDPKGSKDSAFNSWVKLLGTTYLELFIRLAVIFFAFAIITSFIDKYNMFGSIDNLAEGVVDVAGTGWEMGGNVMATLELTRWTFIIMSIALLIFAKDAPKFIKQMLGIKDNGSHFFSTIGTALGFGVSAVGAVGSFNNSRQASWTRDRNNAIARGMTEQQAAAFADRNRGKHLVSGLFGAGVGVAEGIAAASESKGNGLAKVMASVKAQSKHNRKVSDAADNGAGLLDAIRSTGQKVVRGRDDFERENAQLKLDEQRNKAASVALKQDSDALKVRQNANDLRKAVDDRATAKAKDKDGIMGTYGITTGYEAIDVNWKKYNSAHEAAKSGNGVHWVYRASNPQAAQAAGLKTELTKQEFDALSASQQQLFSDESYFEVDSENATVNNGTGKCKILMREAEAISGSLLKENARDLYEQTVAYEQNGTSRAHDDDILASRRVFFQETGQHMEATYEDSVNHTGMRDVYASEKEQINAASVNISRRQREISAEDQRISQAKQSPDYRRNESANSYIDGGNSGH